MSDLVDQLAASINRRSRQHGFTAGIEIAADAVAALAAGTEQKVREAEAAGLSPLNVGALKHEATALRSAERLVRSLVGESPAPSEEDLPNSLKSQAAHRLLIRIARIEDRSSKEMRRAIDEARDLLGISQDELEAEWNSDE